MRTAEPAIDRGLPGEALELELTESILIADVEDAMRRLTALSALGVRLAIDDFGTGYSSLSYLKRFPIERIKIDRSFVVDFDKSENDASLVTAIIAMGKSLNLRMVAEGVDDIKQFNFLRDNGIKIIQGYLFSKPVPADDFAALLRRGGFDSQISDMDSAA